MAEYSTQNYREQGGSRWVVGGELEVTGELNITGTMTIDGEAFGPAAAQADSTASDASGLKTDFNALLAKLRAAGLLET